MQPINWFDLTPPPLLVSPITLLSTFIYKIQAHYLLQRQPPLQSRRCNRRRLLPKRLKIIDAPVHLSCHFSVWTKHKSILEPKLEILIYMQDQYLSATSNENLSPTLSHNIKILFTCGTWIALQTRITCYISEYIYLHIFCVNFLFKRHLSRGHRISRALHTTCKGRIANHSVDW